MLIMKMVKGVDLVDNKKGEAYIVSPFCYD